MDGGENEATGGDSSDAGGQAVHVGCVEMPFYGWRDRPLSATAERREQLKHDIRLFVASDEICGYRRVHA